MLRLYLLAITSLICITRAQQHNAEPTVKGSTDGGWQSFPDVGDATAYPEWVVNKGMGAYMPVYQTAGQNATQVTRAIIVLHGKERACWSDWNSLNNALYNATYNDPTIKREHISILGPCFFTEADLKGGAAKDGQLLWGTTTWISGHPNIAPDSVSGFSSFDVLDALVAYYMDKSVYPNLKVLIVGGHSAGGQTTQRYAALRKSTKNDDRLQFWIANPGSLCWLTSDRPFPDDSCQGVDEFKYGLESNFPAYAASNALSLGREGIINRYHSRALSYAWGLKDEGNGDTRCQAEVSCHLSLVAIAINVPQTQGSSHIARGKQFVAMLENMGGIPNLTTVDWVPGVSHNTAGMMASDAGIDKVKKVIY
ncbi:uncharacterized protein EV420DRAFT_887162 [Desarmillaria tabescens]|uniref:Uncharacterized protein n=1 Tax=Armillaria tabescens TaxID=1929756 RepID=A0AA39MUU0_ARMTA|nr:uncharacterized protein EV420DRAFT_887162 [Desarmillaria tabescens]KAK0447033.1 hypothetical protein EV420DRAFT_887162 [Desarmillaria tabescens]